MTLQKNMLKAKGYVANEKRKTHILQLLIINSTL